MQVYYHLSMAPYTPFKNQSSNNFRHHHQGEGACACVTKGLKGARCVNFFSSPECGQQLLKQKITMVTTVQKNKPELPPALLTRRGERLSHQSLPSCHHHPSFSHPKEKPDCGPPEHTAQQHLTSVIEHPLQQL